MEQQLFIYGMKTKNPFKITEHDLMNWCISYLSLKGHYVQRINSGSTMASYGSRTYRIKMAEKGTPDIIGYHGTTGKFIGIEVKVKPNTPMPAQLEFINNLNRCGGIGAIVYSQDEMMAVKGL